MATTTNYGWTTPDDTALVKDGAAAIRSLGTAIDTSFAADEGDLLVGGTSDIFEALPIGAAGTVLTSDGDTAEWVAPASGGGMTSIASGSLSGSSVVLSSIPATYNNLELIIKGYRPSAGDQLAIQFNGDSGANRYEYGSVNISSNDTFERTDMQVQNAQNSTTSNSLIKISIPDYTNTSTWKFIDVLALLNNASTSANLNLARNWGAYNQTSAISSITLFPAAGTFSAGTYILYGVK